MQVILNKVPSLIISKRFWIGFFGSLTMLAIAINPDLADSAPQLEASVLAIVLFLIKGYSDQDTASANQGVNKYNQTKS